MVYGDVSLGFDVSDSLPSCVIAFADVFTDYLLPQKEMSRVLSCVTSDSTSLSSRVVIKNI